MRKAIIVTGGRDYADSAKVAFYIQAQLSELISEGVPKDQILVIAGGATGADSLAVEHCQKHKIRHMVMYADWDTHGRRAGPLRNTAMLDEAITLVGTYSVRVLAFPGGAGTTNMCRTAELRGVSVIKAPVE